MPKDNNFSDQIEQTSALLLNYMTLTTDTVNKINSSGYLVPEVFEPAAKMVVTTHPRQSSIDYAFASHADPDVDSKLSKTAAYNATKLKEFLGAKHFCMMRQVHGSQVNIVDTFSSEAEEQRRMYLDVMMGDVQRRITVTDDVTIIDGDGLVTNQPKCALVVLTADCVPLLLCDSQAGVIGAVHCGWKGIYKNIIFNTIVKMQKLGARPENIQAYMGPAIGPMSFEVGERIALQFCLRNDAFKEAFEPVQATQDDSKDDDEEDYVESKCMCDIYKLCRICLTSLGVKPSNITGGEFDTMLQNEIFFSYRHNGTQYRMASAVMLK